LIIGIFLINGAHYRGVLTGKQLSCYKIFLHCPSAALRWFTLSLS